MTMGPKKVVAFALVTLALLVAGLAVAETSGWVAMRDMSLGLYTRPDIEDVPAGAGTIVHNVDLHKNVGALTVRDGYDDVVTVYGTDSILVNGLFAARYRDGTKQLFAAVDGFKDPGYGDLYVTAKNTISFGILDTMALLLDAGRLARFDSGGVSVTYVDIGLEVGGFYVAGSRPVWWDYADTIRFTCVELPDLPRSTAEIMDSLQDSIVSIINGSLCSLYVTAAEVGDTVLVGEVADYGLEIDGSYEVKYSYNAYETNFPFSEIMAISEVRGSEISGEVATYVPVTKSVDWEQFDQMILLSNSVAKSTIYNGYYTSTLPLTSPGECYVTPLSDSCGMRGNYRYALRYAGLADSGADTIYSNHLGYLSTDVVSEYDKVLLHHFPPAMIDGICETDSTTYDIFRSTGTFGFPDKADSVYWIGQVVVDSTNYLGATFIDSLSDADLLDTGRTNYEALPMFEEAITRNMIQVPDSVARRRYPGAPSILGTDSIDNSASAAGIWANAPFHPTMVGYVWYCQYVDTLSGIPSDTGEATALFAGGGPDSAGDYADWFQGVSRQFCEKVTLVLPRTNDSNVQCLLWRAPVIPIKTDTNWSAFSEYGFWSGGWFEGLGDWRQYYTAEYAAPYGYLVGRFDPGDTVIDSMDYNKLVASPSFTRNSAPPYMTDLLAFDQRLFATDGDRVFVSQLKDSLLTFTILDEVWVDPYQGEKIIGLVAAPGGVVKVIKQRSTYTLGKDGNGYWKLTQLSGDYGAVAPRSIAVSPLGNYMLSEDGVRRVEEGQYKAQSFIQTIMSASLDNFDDISPADMFGAFAVYHDQKYMLTIPGIDTLYVMHEIIQPGQGVQYAWATWSVPMAAATHYDPDQSETAIIDDTLLFSQAGSNVIYQLGKSGLDGGTAPVNWQFRTGQINQFSGLQYDVSDVVLGTAAEDTTNPYLRISFIGDRDTTVTDLNATVARLDTARYHWFSQSGAAPSVSWIVDMTTSRPADSVWQPSGEAAIQSLMINLIPRGTPPKE